MSKYQNIEMPKYQQDSGDLRQLGVGGLQDGHSGPKTTVNGL